MIKIPLANEQLPYWFDRDNFGNRNVGMLTVIKGETFNQKILERAIAEAISDSKILNYKVGRLFPIMQPGRGVHAPTLDIFQSSQNALKGTSMQTFKALLAKPSQFQEPPLISCFAGIADADTWSFGFVCPHIVMDGFSTIKFIYAIADNYLAIKHGDPTKLYRSKRSYLDFIAENSGPSSLDIELFWRNYMAKSCDMEVQASLFAGQQTYVEQNIDNECIERLEKFSNQSKISLQAIYLYIFYRSLVAFFNKKNLYLSYVMHGISSLRYIKSLGNFATLNTIYITETTATVTERLSLIDKEIKYLKTKSAMPDVGKVYLYESKFWSKTKVFRWLSKLLSVILRTTSLKQPKYNVSHKYVAKFGSEIILSSLGLLKKRPFLSPTLVIMPQYYIKRRMRLDAGDVIYHSDLEPIDVRVPENLMYLYLSRDFDKNLKIALTSHIKGPVARAFLECFTQQCQLLLERIETDTKHENP